MPTQSPRPAKRKAVYDPEEQEETTESQAHLYPRKRVSIACDVCRLRKTRCDAKRPSCSLCAELEIECVYKKPSHRDRVPLKDVDAPISSKRLEKIEATLDAIASVVGLNRNRENHVIETPIYQEETLATSPVSFSGSNRHRYAYKMPNLLLFKGPMPDSNPWSYDCNDSFFTDQMASEIEMRQALRAPTPPLDLSKPQLWKLQRSFADNFLKWLPLFDHETTARHLQSAQTTNHSQVSPSLCLTFFMYAIGAIASSDTVFIREPSQLPGFSYYTRAVNMIEDLTCPTNDMSLLQCRVLMSVYLIFALRPMESWKIIFQVSQDCIVRLKAGGASNNGSQAKFEESFNRIFWICYVLENELEVCLELPASGIRSYETTVPLPTSHYDEEGMFYLLALSSLRKLMVEAVDTVGLKARSIVTYAPVVALELRNQIDDWYNHLPSSLRFPLDHSVLFDTRRAHLRCQYYALVAVVSWPFVLRCDNVLYEVENTLNEEETERLAKGASDCLKAARDFLHAAEEILTQKSLITHLVIRGYFATSMILLLAYPGSESTTSTGSSAEDSQLLEQALRNLAFWKIIPFMAKPLEEMERIARLKNLIVH